jgi:hypothetical protein
MSLQRFINRNKLWVIYFIFVLLAIAFHQGEQLVFSQGPYPFGKLLFWAIYLSFLAYSLYCHVNENFFKSVGAMTPRLWFRQISIDLYLGILIATTIIYLNEGSLFFLALWLVPLVLFANLATLLYLAMNYDSLIARFIS